MQIPPNPFKTNSGYGLALIIVFVISTVLIGSSFQLLSAPTIMTYLSSSSQDSLNAQQLGMSAMDTVEADILSKLNAGDTIDAATYRYPASGTVNITAPQDPNNLGGASTVVGSYYATLTVARDRAYVITIYTTVGGATTTYSKLILADNATTEFDCSIVEGKIFNGEIGKASLTDAELIEWAQNDCMIKTASVNPTVPTVDNAGTHACGATHNVAVPIKLAALSCGSATNLEGTASAVYLQSGTSISNSGSGLYSKLTSGSRTIHIPGSVAAGAIVSGLDSSYPHTWLFNAAAAAGHFTLKGSTGDDNITFNGNANAYIELNGGNHTVIVTGTYGQNPQDLRIFSSGTGTFKVYADQFKGNVGPTIKVEHFGIGSAEMYFNSLGGGNITFDGRAQNDIISCGVSFSGGTPTCGTLSAGTYTFQGRDGNDIISINAKTPNSTYIDGSNGHDILYTKGCSNGTNIFAIAGPSSGDTTVRNLVISGGNRDAGCTITGAGSSILMKKSGSTDAGTISGFAKTLTY